MQERSVMGSNSLEQTVAAAKDLSPEAAIPKLRDVILGNHPNDADSIKAKEQVHNLPTLLRSTDMPSSFGAAA